MSRRPDLLILALIAGCANPAVQLPAIAAAPASPAASRSAPVAEPVQPPIASGEMSFDAWAAQFYPKAILDGVPPQVLDRELKGLTPDPRIVTQDQHQPEFSKPLSDYIKGVVSDGRVAIGRRKLAEVPGLSAVEQRYGVPGAILVGVWAMESSFGAIQGDYDVIRSLATLAAHEPRRRAFAETELIAALKIIASGEATRDRLRGSWAGAMGQTQFIPSSYRSTAVDGDGDGRRDIWASSADALASAANLLSKGGWLTGQSWAREVTAPPNFDFSLSETAKETPAGWAEKGVKRADGLPWSAADQGAKAQLAAPTGAAGPIFLLFPNHFVIRKYNNSVAYALGVGLLADRLAGGDGLVRPWPQETPLSRLDRMTAQSALTALGFSPGAPDGVVGMGTRAALRAWQKANGLTADGYLSVDMVQRLKAAAGPL